MKNKLFGMVFGDSKIVIGDFKKVFIDNKIMNEEGEYERFKEECFKSKDVWFLDDIGFCEGDNESEVMMKLVKII
jgi:chromosomal replication initiation ATPase DnaA